MLRSVHKIFIRGYIIIDAFSLPIEHFYEGTLEAKLEDVKLNRLFQTHKHSKVGTIQNEVLKCLQLAGGTSNTFDGEQLIDILKIKLKLKKMKV